MEFYPRVMTYLARRTPPDVAEDLAAETFVRAMAAMQAGRGPASSASGWIFRIAHNLVVDFYRSRDRAQEVGLDDVADVLHGELMEEEVLRAADVAWLRRALGWLRDEQATVVELRLAGYGFAEIGEVMGKETGAAKALYCRALVTLRRWGGAHAEICD